MSRPWTCHKVALAFIALVAIVLSSSSAQAADDLRIVILSGDQQSRLEAPPPPPPFPPLSDALRGAAFQPLWVKVTRARDGAPASGVAVTWTITSPDWITAQARVNGATTATSTTDAAGNATLGGEQKVGVPISVRAFCKSGAGCKDTAIMVKASAGSESASFSLVVKQVPPREAPAPLRKIVAVNNGQRRPANSMSFAPLTVKVSNPDGTPAVGHRVEFMRTGDTSRFQIVRVLFADSNNIRSSAVTDANGLATSAPFTVTCSDGVGASQPVTSDLQIFILASATTVGPALLVSVPFTQFVTPVAAPAPPPPAR